VIGPTTSLWFARHEFRLGWREWRSMMTAGDRRNIAYVVAGLLIFAAVMHLPAYSVVVSFADTETVPDRPTLIVVTTTLLLYGSLITSQALESVTRAFYQRSDLDLILAAPISQRRFFSVRIGTIAAMMAMVALLMAAPVIDALAFVHGAKWLAGFGVVATAGLVATAIGVAITIALFRLIGPRRTRLASQIIAAAIGAAFVIGLQAMAILHYGTLAQPSSLATSFLGAFAPEADSPVWWPARAIMGDFRALAGVVMVGIAVLAGTMAIFSGRFGEDALAAASATSAGRQRKRTAFRQASPRVTLRRKEWALLRRDPWLASQTLTQLFYLVPPALLLSRNLGNSGSSIVVIIFAMVAVAGQLGGGLAWLAISGEDAPDLVATAPIRPSLVLRAKIEAVMGAIALIFAPFVAAIAILSPADALVVAGGAAIAALSSVRIQLWFRAQAKRSNFRRRYTSSRLATFAEGFASFSWAGTAGLAASGNWLAASGGAVFALIILFGAWSVSPRRPAT
jgi:ABC-2 type transport system permease protein